MYNEAELGLHITEQVVFRQPSCFYSCSGLDPAFLKTYYDLKGSTCDSYSKDWNCFLKQVYALYVKL